MGELQSLKTGGGGCGVLIEMMKPWWRLAAPGFLGVMAAGMAAVAAMPPHEGPPSRPGRAGAPPLGALAGLERGLWELREKGVPGGSPAIRQCIRHPSELMQVRHAGSPCRYFVVADRPGRAVLTYQCENSGTGRTDLRVETTRLVQIETQGIAEGAPFSQSLEGRWIGNCR